jgi:hypothetical protein
MTKTDRRSRASRIRKFLVLCSTVVGLVGKFSASKAEARPASSVQAESADSNFQPPLGWKAISRVGEGVLFAYAAPNTHGGSSPGYLEVKRVDLDTTLSTLEFLHSLENAYATRYQRLEVRRQRIAPGTTGSSESAVFEVAYDTVSPSGQSIRLVESNRVFIGARSLDVVKFVFREAEWAAFAPRAYDWMNEVRLRDSV